LPGSRLIPTRARIDASCDGIVVATYVETFEEETAQASILRNLDARDIEMVIDVPERFISMLPMIEDLVVSFTALDDLEMPAEITEVGAEASVTTGPFPVTLQMAQPGGRVILPGMTGRARGTPRGPDAFLNGIFVPPAAVFTPEGDDQPHVRVVDEVTMTVVERPVSHGAA